MSDDVFDAETYADLARAYLDMNLVEEAAKIVGQGLRLYPSDTALRAIVEDARLVDTLAKGDSP